MPRGFDRMLMTSTALAVIMLAAPALAQTNGSNAGEPRNQGGNQTSYQREMKQRYANPDRVQWRNYSDERHFSKIDVAAASDLVGKTLGSDDGGASGDIEYMLIEPVSGKVMYFLVGMGGMMTVNQDLAVVPWEAVNISRKQDGDDLSITLRAGAQTLRNAPQIDDSQLDELTSPRFHVNVRHYWAPVTEDRQRGASNGSQNRNGRQASRRDTRSNGYDRQYYREDGSVWDGRRSVVPDNVETRSDRQASSQDDRSARNRDVDDMTRGAARARRWADDEGATDQARNQQGQRQDLDQDRQAQNGQRQDLDQERQAQARDQERQAQNRQAEDRQDQARQDQARQGQDGDQVYALVARSYITALMPPTVMRPDQLRGASVSNRSGDEIGAVDRLVIDTERGYVAYALVSEGGFLGIGESYNPVPIQALRWVAGEAFVLPVTQEKLQSMPKLTTSDLPSSVRRTHIERLYDQYDARPYWQQARMNRQQDDGSAGSGQRDRQMRDRQGDSTQSRNRDQEQSQYRGDNGDMRRDRDRQN